MELPSSLAAIYAVYDDFLSGIPYACAKGCSTCCTGSVTMTTLEAAPIVSFLEKRRPDLVARVAGRKEKTGTFGARPLLTANAYAGYFLARQEPSDEDVSPWCFAPCVFLEQDCCAIYPLRPFGCRSFGSVSRCEAGGAAELPPFVITVNTVVMQIIEDLDGPGGSWGVMGDVLAAMMIAGDSGVAGQLASSRPLPGFLVPGEEKRAIAVLLQRLHGAGLADWRPFLGYAAP